MSCSGKVSFSGVMAVLWMRNLSLHFASSGGSSFIAWSMTEGGHGEQGLRLETTGDAPWTSIVSPGSTRPEFGRTQ